MKRCRPSARKAVSTATPFPLSDTLLSDLSTALRTQHGVVVLDPKECVAHAELSADARHESLRSLVLVVLSAAPPNPQQRFSASSEGTPSAVVVHGLGVTSCTAAHPSPGAASAAPFMLCRAVPVLARITPWVPRFPASWHRAVCVEGRCASVGNLHLGRGAAGTVPEGWVVRDVVALLRGLPRCCVEAVSGVFPVFTAAAAAAGAATRVGGEMDWELLPLCEGAEEGARAALAHRHMAALEPFSDAALSSLSRLTRPAPPATRERPDGVWALVSYPDGAPEPRATSAEPTADRGTRRVKKDTMREEHSTAADGCAAPLVSPAFLVPQSLLCQQLSIVAGWQRVAPRERGDVMAVMNGLRDTLEAVALPDGVGVRVDIDSPLCPRGAPGATLMKASVM